MARWLAIIELLDDFPNRWEAEAWARRQVRGGRLEKVQSVPDFQEAERERSATMRTRKRPGGEDG